MEEKGKETMYFCEKCQTRFNLAEAREKDMKCCGAPLRTETERVTKSTPTPFGS